MNVIPSGMVTSPAGDKARIPKVLHPPESSVNGVVTTGTEITIYNESIE